MEKNNHPGAQNGHRSHASLTRYSIRLLACGSSYTHPGHQMSEGWDLVSNVQTGEASTG